MSLLAVPPRWLFVSYGGGHVKALLPVARRVHALGFAQPFYLALTTAAREVRLAGLPTLGFLDLIEQSDMRAREQGERLASELKVQATDRAESVAYLGLSYVDLEDRIGRDEAAYQYMQYGRQAFLPLGILERALRTYQPELVIATNSPRAEQAAIQMAHQMKIPSVCLVDLLGLWEQDLLAQPEYASALCVLNEGVRRRLLGAGRDAAEVHVTGNPAFDGVNHPEMQRLGAAYRSQAGWKNLNVCLYASSPEPRLIPGIAGTGDPEFPRIIESALVQAVTENPSLALWIRRHPSEATVETSLSSRHERIRVCTADMPLHACLHASDEVVVSTSTVGVEAALAGKPVLQVRGSILDHLVPYVEMGLACKPLALSQIASEYGRKAESRRNEHARWIRRESSVFPAAESDATERVTRVLQEIWKTHAES